MIVNVKIYMIMKNKSFLPLFVALAFGTAVTAQVKVQPMKDVHTVVIEDAVSMKVYFDREKGNELEVSSNDVVAKVVKGVMTMDGATKAVLHLGADSPITHFNVQDAAKLELIGPFDFGDNQFTVHAEDAGNVKMIKVSETDTIRTGYVILHSEDGSRIVGDVPVQLTSYTLRAEDNSYIELPSIDLKPGTVPEGKTYEMISNDNGKVRVLGHVAYLNINLSSEDSTGNTHEHVGRHSYSSSRDFELNWFWGFNNWGSKPFSGFGGVDGDASLTYYFMNYGFSVDAPIIDKKHFGLYVGLGMDGNIYHFDSPLVNFNGTGFQSATTSNVVQVGGTMDINNWDSYFNTAAITLPVTLSFEPWEYDGICIRLSAIPGVNVDGVLEQQYKTKAVQINARDRQVRKRVNPFMLDARLTLMYDNFGIYLQAATLPLFKSGVDSLYPVKFGLFWTLSDR